MTMISCAGGKGKLCLGVLLLIFFLQIYLRASSILTTQNIASAEDHSTRNTTQLSSSSTQCIESLTDCDLSCLDWTIVLAMGRSGSTTLQQMITKLPGMNFYGEEGGILEHFMKLQRNITYNSKHHEVSWYGAQDINVTTTACMVQKFYSERHGEKCLHRGCKHGFKEVKYRSPEMMKWIRTIFPTSRIILNYRSECPDGYKDIFYRNCTRLEMETNSFLNAYQHIDKVFHMELENLNNLTKWRDLSMFLGYDNCTALKVTTSNKNRGYSRKFSSHNPWNCSSSIMKGAGN